MTPVRVGPTLRILHSCIQTGYLPVLCAANSHTSRRERSEESFLLQNVRSGSLRTSSLNMNNSFTSTGSSLMLMPEQSHQHRRFNRSAAFLSRSVMVCSHVLRRCTCRDSLLHQGAGLFMTISCLFWRRLINIRLYSHNIFTTPLNIKETEIHWNEISEAYTANKVRNGDRFSDAKKARQRFEVRL